MADKSTKSRVRELHAMNDQELAANVEAARKAIYLFHKDRLSKPQENNKIVKNSRKEIARSLTLLSQRRKAAQETIS